MNPKILTYTCQNCESTVTRIKDYIDREGTLQLCLHCRKGNLT